MITRYIDAFLADLPQSVSQGLERFLFRLFLLGLAVFLAGAYIQRRRPEGWLDYFDGDFSLWRMIRVSVHLVFSRWWIIGIPLIAEFLIMHEAYILNLPDYISGALSSDCPDSLCRGIDSVDNYYLVSEEGSVISRIIVAINGRFEAPADTWLLPLASLFGIVASFYALIWFEDNKDAAEENDDLSWTASSYFPLALLVFPLSILFNIFIYYLVSTGFESFLNVEEMSLFWIVVGFLTGTVAGFLGKSVLFSFWFALLYRTGLEWRRRIYCSCGQDDTDEKAELVKIVLAAFPAIFLITLVLTIAEVYPNVAVLLLFSSPNVIYGIAVVLVWALFPLPFIMARNRTGLKKSLSILFLTWLYHFRKLLSLGALTVAAGIPGALLINIFNMHEHLVAFYAVCHRWTWTGFINLLPFLVLAVPVMMAFFVTVLAFETGGLDVSENTENESP